MNNVQVEAAGSFNAHNFRAINAYSLAHGHKLKSGMLYRTGDLSQLTSEGVRYLKSLGVQSVVDLRSQTERLHRPYYWLPDIDPCAWGDENVVSSASISSLLRQGEAAAEDVSAAMIALYRTIPTSHARSIREIILRVVRAKAPVVFGCAAGKDRTGVAAALILWQLGVPRDMILDDYLQTNSAFHGLLRIAQQNYGWNPDNPGVHAVMRADPDYLSASFDEINRHGGIDCYFEEVLELDEATRKAFRLALSDRADQIEEAV